MRREPGQLWCVTMEIVFLSQCTITSYVAATGNIRCWHSKLQPRVWVFWGHTYCHHYHFSYFISLSPISPFSLLLAPSIFWHCNVACWNKPWTEDSGLNWKSIRMRREYCDGCLLHTRWNKRWALSRSLTPSAASGQAQLCHHPIVHCPPATKSSGDKRTKSQLWYNSDKSLL